MGEMSKAGKALMRAEVARGTASLLTALRRLFPDGSAELDQFAAETAEEAMPDAVPLDRGIFMHVVGADDNGRVKRGTAADAAGWRWEHVEWLVKAGGADSLYDLCNGLWLGTIDLGWIHAGRNVGLRKPGDPDDQDDPNLPRKIRPIGVCGILLNLIGMVSTRQFGPVLAAIFDPQPEEGCTFSPFNGGVAAKAGMPQIQHSVLELLARHPDWGVAQIDADAAFQNCSRSRFLKRIKQLAPGAYRWAKRCYSTARPRYVRMEDGSVQVIWCSSGTTQGDPWGPANHNFTIDELVKEFGTTIDAALLYYLWRNNLRPCGGTRALPLRAHRGRARAQLHGAHGHVAQHLQVLHLDARLRFPVRRPASLCRRGRGRRCVGRERA